jgi:hypothetical protein
MARFAHSCVQRAIDTTKALEATLGPGTSDLALRFGIHSGRVTAGVLRGEKSRFQLFGDTMNFAERMEGSGVPNKVHVSMDTADLLVTAGKSHWLTEREDKVEVKGIGQVTTFWLEINHRHKRSSRNSASSLDDEQQDGSKELLVDKGYEARTTLANKLDRLIVWNVDVLMQGLRKVVARRNMLSSVVDVGSDAPGDGHYRIPLDEMKEVVHLPAFNAECPFNDSDSVVLSPEVYSEMRDYVSQIAGAYQDNPFHNFEHASHVLMSANKLLRRIIDADAVNFNQGDHKAFALNLHRHTYGISTDPLTQFAVVFAALIHDVGHTGVPNRQLALESPVIASKYRQKAIAEQRSIDIAWELLMAPCYSKFRKIIFTNAEEQAHFRQLVVNAIMATDIFDKQMAELRKLRWEKAFGDPDVDETNGGHDKDHLDRRATIVIEHIMQASDVAHTMQHWHVYIKWNERLFHEMYGAFLENRSGMDPSKNWYKGELWFFDNYITPLAHCLKECGVFGVSGDEYLNYAIQNRVEWESEGQSVIDTWLEYYKDD